MYHDDFVATELGQTGTQFDGLGHIGCEVGKRGDLAETRWYNGLTELEMYNINGLTKLGIDKAKPIFTRGVLVDMVAHLGRNMNLNEPIAAGRPPGRSPEAETSRRGASSPVTPSSSAPAGPSSTGSRTTRSTTRAVPASTSIPQSGSLRSSSAWLARTRGRSRRFPGEPNRPFTCHQELITKNGIFLHENMDLTELGKDRVYEFVYVFAPMRIKGGTGSPGRPIAIV